MIIDRRTTRSTTLYESLILMIVVESLSTTDTIVVGSTQLVHIVMPIIVNIFIVPPILTFIALMQQIIALASSHGGLYFDGQ